MGLARKTFFYSIPLAAVMIAFITGYFIFMLPSLYADYVMNHNLASVVEIQNGYPADRSYDNLAVRKNRAACDPACRLCTAHRICGPLLPRCSRAFPPQQLPGRRPRSQPSGHR